MGETVPEATLATSHEPRVATSSANALSAPLSKRKLSNIGEQFVLKAGLKCLQARFAARLTTEQLLSFPRRPDGSLRLLRSSASFFEGLLSQKFDLKQSLAGDVSAAQSDIKYLKLDQLLAIRVDALDFATESSMHATHTNFLEMIDRHLFEQLARQHLRITSSGPSDVVGKAKEQLYMLGVRMSLILGAICLLDKENSDDSPELPACWALPLDNSWPGCPSLLFNTQDLWVEVHARESTDITTCSGAKPVAVLWERCSGRERLLHWEIAIVEPQHVPAELEAARNSVSGAGRRKLSEELTVVLRRRTNKPEASAGA